MTGLSAPSLFKTTAGQENRARLYNLSDYRSDDTPPLWRYPTDYDAGEAYQMPTDSELTDAKIAASEARGDTKVARLEGKIDAMAATIAAKIDSLSSEVIQGRQETRDSKWVLLAVVVGSAIALGGLGVTMATYGDALFGRGMSVRDVVQTTIKETLEQQKRDATKPQ